MLYTTYLFILIILDHSQFSLVVWIRMIINCWSIMLPLGQNNNHNITVNNSVHVLTSIFKLVDSY
jgi:hypothetical protein